MHYSFPALNIHTQCSTVDLGMESHIDASPIDRPPSVTGHTAPPPPPPSGEDFSTLAVWNIILDRAITFTI